MTSFRLIVSFLSKTVWLLSADFEYVKVIIPTAINTYAIIFLKLISSLKIKWPIILLITIVIRLAGIKTENSIWDAEINHNAKATASKKIER